jgi:hypothetical protein
MKKMKKTGLVFVLIIISSITTLSSEIPDSLKIEFSPYLNPKYHFGVELNPGLILYARGQKSTVVSAGFSYFPKNRKSELTIPIVYEYSKNGKWFHYDFGKSINLELHYRKFLPGKVGGIYSDMGIKYNYAYSKPSNDYEYSEPIEPKSMRRLGLGCGVGYRIFSDDRFYWGIGIFIGSYFLGQDIDNNTGISSIFFTSDERSFLTFQLLKVGYAF